MASKGVIILVWSSLLLLSAFKVNFGRTPGHTVTKSFPAISFIFLDSCEEHTTPFIPLFLARFARFNTTSSSFILLLNISCKSSSPKFVNTVTPIRRLSEPLSFTSSATSFIVLLPFEQCILNINTFFPAAFAQAIFTVFVIS